MNRLHRPLIACCILLFTAVSARAEMKVTFANRGDFEIINIYQEYDSESRRDDVGLIPGSETTYVSDDASQLNRVGMDAGVMYYEFKDMSDLSGRFAMTLKLDVDSDNRPRLTLDGKNAVEKGEKFGLEAGPLWNNDHAEQQCPQALQHWLDQRPGAKAEWTGDWKTTIKGQASVCLIEVTADGGAPIDLGAAPAWSSVDGAATLLVAPDETGGTPLDGLLQAKTMDDLRAAGAKKSPTMNRELLLTARFADKSWAAVASPGKDGGIKKISLRAFAQKGLAAETLNRLAENGYRPWRMQIDKGPGKENQTHVQFETAYPAMDEARSFALKQFKDAQTGKKPTAVACLLISEEAYENLINSGSPENIPAFTLRHGGKKTLVLEYLPDAGGLL